MARYIEVRTTACHAGSDGDCDWARCPQERDGEPGKTGRDCPLLNTRKIHTARRKEPRP